MNQSKDTGPANPPKDAALSAAAPGKTETPNEKILLERIEENEILLRQLQSKNESLANRLREALQWRMVRELEEETVKLRQLPALKHIAMQSINKQETRQLIARLLDRDMPESLAIPQGRALSILGALPPGADLRTIVQNLYSEQVGGLYDDSTGKLYVTSLFEPGSRVGRVILAHEICHALQDQNFDFSKWPLHIHDNDDRVLAAACAAEGDATILMTDYIRENASLMWLLELPGMMSLDQKQLNAAPPYLQYSLVFPYLEGMRFIMDAQLRGGMKARNDALLNPPATTEQVLHPEKYFASPAEEATSVSLVDLAPALGPGWRRRSENTLGEAGIRAVLLPRMRPLSFRYFSLNPLKVDPAIERAADGWAGDRLAIYMKDAPPENAAPPSAANNDPASKTLVLSSDSLTSPTVAPPAIVQWRIEWDTAADADQFASYAAEIWIPRILPGARESQADAENMAASARAWRSEPEGAWAILLRPSAKVLELRICDGPVPLK